jgi:protein subunit release factor B
MKRQRILSVTKDDLDITDIRGSGPGGQHRNKSYTGVRIKHRDSGAVGEATDSRSHETNRSQAFLRMTETPEFKVWLDLAIYPEKLLIEKRVGDDWVRI